MRYLIVLFFILRYPGCDIDDLAVNPGEAEPPSKLVLHPGQTVVLLREGMTLTFQEITTDSRCPTGGVCVWQGDAAARMVFKDRFSVVKDCTLHTTLDPKFIAVRSVGLRMTRVAPYPRMHAQIDSADYLATVEISRIRK